MATSKHPPRKRLPQAQPANQPSPPMGRFSNAQAKASALFPQGTTRPQIATTTVTDDISALTDEEKAHTEVMLASRKAQATDMRLMCSITGHMATVRTAVKEKLFPVNKFITSNNDLDYHTTEGICAYMLHACSVTSNSRAWWNHYKLVVKRTLANHRNNRIKAMQQVFIAAWNENLIHDDQDNVTDSTRRAVYASAQLHMRKEPKRRGANPNYMLFLKEYMPALLGMQQWAGVKKSRAPISQHLTVTDEAFMLVVLHNYAERWIMMADRVYNNIPLIPAGAQTGHDGTEWPALPDTKFTKQKANTKPDDKADKTPFNGWTNDGIRGFNHTCELIVDDRSDNPDFDAEFTAWLEPSLQTKSQAQKKRKREVVPVFNELGSFAVKNAEP